MLRKGKQYKGIFNTDINTEIILTSYTNQITNNCLTEHRLKQRSGDKNGLKIPKGYRETVNIRRTKATKNRTKRQVMSDKILHN